MQKPFMRIPYTGPLPPPLIIPRSANTLRGAASAVEDFLRPRPGLHSTVLLTGAGISVASGLADYRGTAGTYTLNKSYRPIYYSEFVASHEARKRYWARSFLGWTTLNRSRPNKAHEAVKALGELGLVRSVITQSALSSICQIRDHAKHTNRCRFFPPTSPLLPPDSRTTWLPPLGRMRALPEPPVTSLIPILACNT